MKFLVDADIVAFKAAAACERPIQWDDGLWTLHAYLHEGKDAVGDYLKRIVDKLGDGEFVLCLTDGSNWRKGVLPTYKMNRSDTRKPLILSALRGWMNEELSAVQVHQLEGDDIMGILATEDRENTVIISEDKDMATIPCNLFNPSKDDTIRVISEFEADRFHMMQTLTGDKTDNYDGCPSIGPVTAEKILAECSTQVEMWEAVVATYAKKKLSEEVALTQARVARILRATDYDKATGAIKLWTPPTK
jgi:DNA polymerase I